MVLETGTATAEVILDKLGCLIELCLHIEAYMAILL
jgi:hypothetical protein